MEYAVIRPYKLGGNVQLLKVCKRMMGRLQLEKHSVLMLAYLLVWVTLLSASASAISSTWT